MTLQVGQTLWYVDTQLYIHKPGRPVTVTKIGRKWVELDHAPRIDKTDLVADGRGYASPGKCWISEADYDAHVSRQRLWRNFAIKVDRLYFAPWGVTERAIRQAAASLNIPLPFEEKV